jgi:predicted glycoside hydrolase/deacetylase ChbG (UPF0249 family)
VPKYVIFNADDFGASTGINRAIRDCHVNGVVTSASLMVTGAAAAEAASVAHDHPALAVGLHWDIEGEGERTFDTRNAFLVRDELRRQIDTFERIMGRAPTHVDSHRHAHQLDHVFPMFRDMIAPLGVPLRGDGRVKFTGGFYAQWEWQVTELKYVSVPFLETMLRDEVAEGWNEFSCHPGYVTPDFQSVYLAEREAEVRTLTDPAIRRTIEALGYRLASFADVPRTR